MITTNDALRQITGALTSSSELRLIYHRLRGAKSDGSISDATADCLLGLVAAIGGDLKARESAPNAVSTTFRPQTPGAERKVHVTVVSASERTFDDQDDPVLIMQLRTDDGEQVPVRLPAVRKVIRQIAFRALGASDVNDLEGRSCEVVLGSFVGRDGNRRPCVNKWLAPPATRRAASPAKRAPSKGAAELKRMDATNAGDDDWDGMPF